MIQSIELSPALPALPESAAQSHPLERIVWVDSGLSYASTWLEEATIVDRAKDWDGRVTTVGQVIYEDDRVVVLCLSRDLETNNWAGAFLIYKPAILTREILARVA